MKSKTMATFFKITKELKEKIEDLREEYYEFLENRKIEQALITLELTSETRSGVSRKKKFNQSISKCTCFNLNPKGIEFLVRTD